MTATTRKNFRFVSLFLYFALSFFVGGRWPSIGAALLVSIFAIRFYRDTDHGWRGFLWLWLVSAISQIFIWRGATALNFMGDFIEPAFFALMTSVGLLPLVIDRLFHRRFALGSVSPFWLTLIYPLAAGGWDYFNANGSPFGTFGAAAYTQAGFNPLMQTAAVGGIWLIPFLLGWFASVVNYAWEAGFARHRIKWPTIGFTTLILLTLGFGFWRTATAAPAETVPVAGFSLPNGEMMAPIEAYQSGDTGRFQQIAADSATAQLAQVRQMAAEGAKIVTLQEGAMMGFEADIEHFLAEAGTVAQEEGIYIVLPTMTFYPGEPGHNMVRIIDPNGDVVLEHVKFGGTQFEGSLTGSGEIESVDTPYGRLSAVICWDADFPEVMKQVGEQDVDLLFVPSNDWLEVRDIHADMATFRAVENGTPIFRQTGNGVSIVTDAYGRVLSRVDSFDEPANGTWASAQVIETATGSVPTRFPIVGNLFGQVQQFGVVGLIGWLLIAWLIDRRRLKAVDRDEQLAPG